MTPITKHPEVERLLATLEELLVPQGWNARRRLAAIAVLEKLAERSAHIAVATSEVLQNRCSTDEAIELATGLVGAMDPAGVGSAAEMQERVIKALEGLRTRKGEAA